MRKFLLLVSLAALTFAGCGGDDGGSTDTASESTSEAEGTDFSGKGSDDFCDKARDYAEKFEDAGDVENETELADDYKEFSKAIDDLADDAPGEIKADVQVVQAAFADLNELLEKYDYDFSKITEEEAADIDLESPEIESANNRIESYFEKVCKIDTDDDGDTDGKIESGDDTDDPAGTEDEQAPDESVDDSSTETTTGE